MDKNKKKTIATAVGGAAVGIGSSEAARLAKDWYDKRKEPEKEPSKDEPNHHTDTPAGNTTTNQEVVQQTPQSTPTHDNYSGITEIQPVDSGGANGMTADVVIDVPSEDIIAGVDDINPDEIAEAIITPVEDIIDNGTDLASNHQPSELELLPDEELIDEVEFDDDDDDLAEAEEDEDGMDDDGGEMIDDIG